MPKDFNQSTSIESYLKLQWVYSNTSIIIIRTLYVSTINAVYNYSTRCYKSLLGSVCSPRSIIHLLRQVKLIGNSGELHWTDYPLKTTQLLIVVTDALKHKLSLVFMIYSDPWHERTLYSP